ncbi:hypothetical protein ACFFX0_09625 [Citricoccus parietis]|uniref:Uncharacterized protein n=1 Tax=Citricoccus parietis TaxID=592307 RepID=A0ABV5FXM8_9MICC
MGPHRLEARERQVVRSLCDVQGHLGADEVGRRSGDLPEDCRRRPGSPGFVLGRNGPGQYRHLQAHGHALHEQRGREAGIREHHRQGVGQAPVDKAGVLHRRFDGRRRTGRDDAAGRGRSHRPVGALLSPWGHPGPQRRPETVGQTSRRRMISASTRPLPARAPVPPAGSPG